MTVIVIILAVIAAAIAGGTARLMHVLRRDRGVLWRPGHQLPDVPADSAIRHWEAS